MSEDFESQLARNLQAKKKEDIAQKDLGKIFEAKDKFDSRDRDESWQELNKLYTDYCLSLRTDDKEAYNESDFDHELFGVYLTKNGYTTDTAAAKKVAKEFIENY